VTSLQDHHHHHHHHHILQQQQPNDVTDLSDTASSIEDAASEMSDDETASVIEVEVSQTDHWSSVNTGHTASSLPSNSIARGHLSAGPPTTSSLPSNYPAASDDSVLRNRSEYVQTAPWRCLPIRHRASIASYSDPDLVASSSAAGVSDIERQRIARARERRLLARSTEISQIKLLPTSSLSSSSSSGVIHVQPAPVLGRLQLITTTTANNNNKQRQQEGVVVSRSSYVPQKPPPPLPMPDNDLAKQLRPVHANDVTSKPSPSTTVTSSMTSSSAREPQRPVRELVAQLSGQTPPIPATTTTIQLPQQQQQQQQQRRQLRRQQLQQLHVRPLSSSSSDAEAEYEIFINTPPAAAVLRSDENSDNKSVRYFSSFYNNNNNNNNNNNIILSVWNDLPSELKNSDISGQSFKVMAF